MQYMLLQLSYLLLISVPAISLEGFITLAVSVARSTGGVTLMACGPVGGSDRNMGKAAMCTVWSSVDCCSSTFPECFTRVMSFKQWGTVCCS